MADVRLTATNPEDSSVVPVACDASGRLLLEEQRQGPPGPEGPRGPKGDDGKDGDPFSGNFADDVTFGGSAEFAGDVTVNGRFSSNKWLEGAIRATRNVTSLTGQGVEILYVADATGGPEGVIQAYNRDDNQREKLRVGSVNWQINTDGSAKFADGKAGFTKEGYLWCTTRRGDTVILDATSNGLANWMEYTPTSRIDDLRDKLDAIRGDTGEMPADTQ